jgi:CDP-paratose synthetase
MRVLLTGATGFVGQYLTRSLVDAGDEVTVLVRNEQKIHLFNELIASIDVIFLSDPLWKTKVKEANPDIVIHLAAFLTSADDNEAIDKLIDSNLLFGTHLLDALSGTSIKLFINTGTFAEYSGKDLVLTPSYLYAATKTAFRSILEYYRKLNNFKVVNVIPYTIYGGTGSNKKLIDLIYESIQSPEPIDLSPGEQVLDFIHINDVVSFYCELVRKGDQLKEDIYEFHLGTGKGTTPKELAQIIEELTGKKTKIRWGGKPYRPRDTMYAVAPVNKPIENIEWSPGLTLHQGIKLDKS